MNRLATTQNVVPPARSQTLLNTKRGILKRVDHPRLKGLSLVALASATLHGVWYSELYSPGKRCSMTAEHILISPQCGTPGGHLFSLFSREFPVRIGLSGLPSTDSCIRVGHSTDTEPESPWAGLVRV